MIIWIVDLFDTYEFCVLTRYRQRSASWINSSDKKPTTEENWYQFLWERPPHFPTFAQQNCVSKGKGAAANAETKPPGLREKAYLKVKSYELRIESNLKTVSF